MTDPMQAAIEVAANALDEELKFEQIGVRDLAEAAYAAIEPLVRNAVADELRQAVAEQSSWLWFELGESALLKVADHIAPRGERA